MKLLLCYLFYENFENKIIEISCREDILKLGEGLLHTTSENIEIVLLEDGTKILDNDYLLALEKGTDIFIYSIYDSNEMDAFF